MRFYLRAVILLALLLPLAWLYVAGRSLAHLPRLHDTVPVVPPPAAGESFAAYRARVAGLVAASLPANAPQQTLAWRLPFEVRPAAGCTPAQDRGVLLFHGLTDSPFSLRDLAAQLSAQCQTVRVMLLPGHGTAPGALRRVTLEDWRLAVDRAVADFAASHPQPLLGGYSLGGALAVDYRQRHPRQPLAGLLLVAPALGLDSGLLWALPLLQGLSAWLPRAGWLEIHADDNPVKYESFPVNGAWQMARLVADLQDAPAVGWQPLPVWAALTADDATVDAAASLRLLCARAAPQASRLLWYGTRPAAGGCAAVQWEPPDPAVRGYSHVALPFSPHNPVYGTQPLYYNCMHYPADSLRWRLCKGLVSGEAMVPVLGEVNEANLGLPLLRRLTYNPAFGPMVAGLLGFIDALPDSAPAAAPPAGGRRPAG